MSENKMIKDILTGAAEGNGIFSAFDNPIWCYDFDPADLDIFFITTYGEKWSSPFLEYFDDEGGISDDNLKKVANSIYRMYKSQWEHLYKANVAEYDPLDNTNVTETETLSKVGTENNLTGMTTDSTNKGTSAADSTGGGSTTNERQGLGSNSYVPDNKSIVSNNSGSATSASDTTGSGTESTALKNYEDDHERKMTKHGNIGVMTFAQLIEGEQSAWRWNFIKGVMQDISDCITLSIY